MVYKENREMFLERGRTIKGERDMRFKENKAMLNEYWINHYENI